MRILWVKAGGLVPLDTGGKIRSYHMLRELARAHEVTLFTFYGAHDDDVHAQLRDLFRQIVCVPLSLPSVTGIGQYLHYARHVFSSQPYTIAKFCRPEVADKLRRLLKSEAYDVIVCDFAASGGVIPWDHPCPKVLFTHNVEALIWRRHFRIARNPLWKAVCWREYRTMARAERDYLERADHVVTVSETDRDFFARLIAPSKITAIRTGVDLDYFQPSPAREEPDTLVFTGSMDWMPNEDGILYFVDEILPSIRRQVPQVTLWVVGRSPSDRVQKLAARDSAVRVTGRVEDIRPYIRNAAVYIVPLRIGSGTRLKIFEAMAMGKAVVSTSVGAEGLPVTPGENILLADQPEEFAGKVLELLRDADARLRLGCGARQVVEKQSGWQSVAAQFESILTSVVEKAPPRRA